MPRRKDRRKQLLIRWWTAGALATFALTLLVVTLARETVEHVPAAGADIEGLTKVLEHHVSQHDVHLKFVDVTEASGLEFVHMPVPRASLLPEDMGSGVAAGDYDQDGFVDLYFVNFSGNAVETPSPRDHRARSRLFRNVAGERFEDVTQSTGTGFAGLGMGAAWGDYDNDGDPDLYVTAYGRNALYANQDGLFVDVTEQSGAGDDRFSAGASWADFDRDGDLDLYVTNYVEFVYRDQDRDVVKRQYAAEQPYTLNPSSYAPVPNALFRNNGDGTFEEVAARAGVDDPEGRSLSASWVDMNNDGWMDLYVANDVSNNAVFLNRCMEGELAFEDVGPSSLAADYRGAMGIAVGDFDNDLDQDLLITHWTAQENALYRNMTTDALIGDSADRRLWFMDDADNVGLGQISLDVVGWATGFCDFDNDGHLDLWLVNGSTMESREDHRRLIPEPSFLFYQDRERGFVDVTAYAAPALAAPAVRRAGTQLDFDRDGRVDLVVTRHGGPAMLLKNTTPNAGHWLRVRLQQAGGNTAAIGARVYLTAAGQTQMREVGASSSYLSQDEPIVHFGLGRATVIDELRVHWPDGSVETLPQPAMDQEIKLLHDAKRLKPAAPQADRSTNHSSSVEKRSAQRD